MKIKTVEDIWYVYIIECQNGKYYTGITKDVSERFTKHAQGKGAKFTLRNLPKRVVYTEKCANIYDARKHENQIKSWDRKKKIELIGGNLGEASNG